jgi:6-pyruvoyltetrahydropterin/6-carboxytetrahydropterin synthase
VALEQVSGCPDDFVPATLTITNASPCDGASYDWAIVQLFGDARFRLNGEADPRRREHRLTYEILVRDEFSAAHQLRMYDGALEPLHGHNWTVEVEMAGPRLDRIDVLVDFTRVQARLRELLGRLHDRLLNEVPELAGRNPSAEAVAAWLFEALTQDVPPNVRLKRVRVWETPSCAAAACAEPGGAGFPPARE